MCGRFYSRLVCPNAVVHYYYTIYYIYYILYIILYYISSIFEVPCWSLKPIQAGLQEMVALVAWGLRSWPLDMAWPGGWELWKLWVPNVGF